MGQSGSSGPCTDGGPWCAACGTWRTEANGLERCPVSHAQMQAMAHATEGLSHLGAYGIHERAMCIWDADAEWRARLSA
jgi:hypothetical protein